MLFLSRLRTRRIAWRPTGLCCTKVLCWVIMRGRRRLLEMRCTNWGWRAILMGTAWLKFCQIRVSTNWIFSVWLDWQFYVFYMYFFCITIYLNNYHLKREILVRYENLQERINFLSYGIAMRQDKHLWNKNFLCILQKISNLKFTQQNHLKSFYSAFDYHHNQI